MNNDKLNDIKMFIMDVDGTLTDGKIYIGVNGESFKAFNIKDGMGIRLLHNKGIITAIITGRTSKIVENRAMELGINEIYQGVDNKIVALNELCKKYDIDYSKIAYIGDDINDISVIELIGFSFAPADCHEVLISKVDYICKKNGGDGAVREAIDLILKSEL